MGGNPTRIRYNRPRLLTEVGSSLFEVPMTQFIPNADQQNTIDKFFAFLFTEEKEFNISGGPGVGKSALIGHMIHSVMHEYEKMCKIMGSKVDYKWATLTTMTNQAACVLSEKSGLEVDTLYSFLNLKVVQDYRSGRTRLERTAGWRVHENGVIFVDEGGMIDSSLSTILHEGTLNCKIVYVGDHCQLGPIHERISPIYIRNIPMSVITTPVRNASQPALVNVVNQARTTVETGNFKPIQIVPGVIDHFSGPELEAYVAANFQQQRPDIRILAYTNDQVQAYNEHIREMRKLPNHFTPGEHLVCASNYMNRKTHFPTEQGIVVQAVADTVNTVQLEPDVSMDVRKMTVSKIGETALHEVLIPEDPRHYSALVKHYGRIKRWDLYFRLKNEYPDFRLSDACTFHKAQGSTFDTVIIDLDNLSVCHQPNTVARMLTVGLSRARERVILYGQLASKYGGLRE